MVYNDREIGRGGGGRGEGGRGQWVGCPLLKGVGHFVVIVVIRCLLSVTHGARGGPDVLLVMMERVVSYVYEMAVLVTELRPNLRR